MRTSNTQPPLGTPLDKSHPLCNGLVLYLPFNENGGMKLKNVAGLGNYDGIINGTAGGWQGGSMGFGYKFNATNNYVSSLCTSTSLMTISFWSKISSISAPDNIGVLFWDGTIVNNRVSCVIAGTNPVVGIYCSNSGPHRENTSKPVLKDGFWHQVVFIVDKSSASNSNIYIDGSEITYTTTTTQIFTGDTGFVLNHFVIGGDSRFSPGILNNVMIWNRKLSASEVRQLYTNQYQMFQQARPLKIAV